MSNQLESQIANYQRWREDIRSGNGSWRELVPNEVAKYIEKYQIYN